MLPIVRSSRPAGIRRSVALVVTALLGSSLVASPVEAAATGVDLRVLLVSNGDASVEALATQMDREGVPYQRLTLSGSGRPTVTADFLTDDATGRGRFQAVVLPNQAGGGLSADELAALSAYEREYGVRQVNAYDFPSTSMGLQPPVYSGQLDGASATVTSAGRADAFRYLRGPVPIDDVDPASLEVYGYVAQPASGLPAGESFTPLVTVTAGGAQGVLAGVHNRNGREELVLTAAYNPHMLWFNELAHGVVTWMTRGVHLGHHRNYFAVQVDDVLLSDSRWSVDGDCTPGDDCVDPGVTTTDIRMTPADVTRLVEWQRANGFKLDMVFNGAGEAAYKAQTGASSDPLTDAFVAAQAEFPWVNHTWSHPYLGCIQVAPTVAGQPWRCATSATDGPRQDPEVPAQESGGTYWAGRAFTEAQLQDNIAFARAKGFTDFDPAELVTGEHSGLRSLPNQPQDNPFLGPALDSVGVRWTASDASREPAPRGVGGATTVPRYPMNIYYNTGTYRDQIDEYNWYYTSRAVGGGGICEANPATSTCITPLPAGTEVEAKASFDGYLKPLEVRNALSKVVANDPRPFYAHQSNLTEDALLYPVVEGVLDSYSAVYDRALAPLVRLDLTGQGQNLQRRAAWASAGSGVTAYVDRSGVHVSGSGEVPLTVPAGTAVNGATLESYGGELSGWVSGSFTAVPTTPAGGYLPVAATVPAAPVLAAVTPADRSATVTWQAPSDTGGSAVTQYRVRVFVGSSAEPLTTVQVTEGTSVTVPGLATGTAYTFDVAAVNAVGASPWSSRSTAVTPSAAVTAPAAPTLTEVTPGNRTISVVWAAPATDGGSPVTEYVVRVHEAGTQTVAATRTVGADARRSTVDGLVNGTSYMVEVTATNSAGSTASLRSAPVTPSAPTPPTTPTQPTPPTTPTQPTTPTTPTTPTRPTPDQPAPALPFSDIADDVHRDAIVRIARAKIALGRPDGTFGPRESVTRGQMASFLVRALKLPATSEGQFSDVRGHTHESAIRALAAAGITTGFSDGTFRPDESVTRGQMASFLTRALTLPAGTARFPDVRGDVHEAAIAAIAARGITTGFPDGTFRPQQPVTRAQMASFLVRALGL